MFCNYFFNFDRLRKGFEEKVEIFTSLKQDPLLHSKSALESNNHQSSNTILFFPILCYLSSIFSILLVILFQSFCYFVCSSCLDAWQIIFLLSQVMNFIKKLLFLFSVLIKNKIKRKNLDLLLFCSKYFGSIVMSNSLLWILISWFSEVKR